jgi:hypothetical protein
MILLFGKNWEYGKSKSGIPGAGCPILAVFSKGGGVGFRTRIIEIERLNFRGKKSRKEPTLAKTARMWHPKNLSTTRAVPPARENYQKTRPSKSEG